jgi:hypothetical protein
VLKLECKIGIGGIILAACLIKKRFGEVQSSKWIKPIWQYWFVSRKNQSYSVNLNKFSIIEIHCFRETQVKIWFIATGIVQMERFSNFVSLQPKTKADQNP